MASISGKEITRKLPLFIKPQMSDKKLNLLTAMVAKANKEFNKKHGNS